MNSPLRKWIRVAAALVGVFLAVRYFLPLVSPFLLGGLLALAAEPMVRFFSGRCRLPRSVAAGLGVSMTLCLLALTVLLLCGLLVRELRYLAAILPELETAVRSGMDSLSGWLLSLARRMPEGIRGVLTDQVTQLFSGGSELLDRGMDHLLTLASGLLSRVPGGALRIFTGIISAFMISGKLPLIRGFLRRKVGTERLKTAGTALNRMKDTVLGWGKAQLKLSGVTFLIAAVGFFLLRIPYAPLWAAVLALVDAFPVLGSGTVLIPWSLISFLQGDRFRAFALLGIYGMAALTRTVLEPRLVGRQLGLDPLVTLMALYAGYRLFGLPGMLLSPMIAVAVTQLAASPTQEQ